MGNDGQRPTTMAPMAGDPRRATTVVMMKARSHGGLAMASDWRLWRRRQCRRLVTYDHGRQTDDDDQSGGGGDNQQ